MHLNKMSYLSYGRLPHIWATLLTKKAMLRVRQKRKLNRMKKDSLIDSSQKYHGTHDGKNKASSAKSGTYNLKLKEK